MAAKKSDKKPVQVSMDIKLLNEVDADSETKKLGRSVFIANAIRAYLRTKRESVLDEQVERAYAGQADEMLEHLHPWLAEQVWDEDNDLVETGPPQQARARRAKAR